MLLIYLRITEKSCSQMCVLQHANGSSCMLTEMSDHFKYEAKKPPKYHLCFDCSIALQFYRGSRNWKDKLHFCSSTPEHLRTVFNVDTFPGRCEKLAFIYRKGFNTQWAVDYLQRDWFRREMISCPKHHFTQP